jgi:hypothetical protein
VQDEKNKFQQTFSEEFLYLTLSSHEYMHVEVLIQFPAAKKVDTSLDRSYSSGNSMSNELL